MSDIQSQNDLNNSSRPLISIIVVVYNMQREAPRTLRTLTPKYQQIDPELYEVIVIENGSDSRLGKEFVESLSTNFKYIYLDQAPESPVSALNRGAELAKGILLGFMIDGARMLSPGVLRYAMIGYKAYRNPVIITLGFHLGSKLQPDAILEGYNQLEEDRLLESVPWSDDGYELFRISTFGGSAKFGWFGPITESNCIFLKKEDWEMSGGFDESFNKPGGGLANLDFYNRVCNNPDLEPIIILGEGNFHQFHNGSMTGKTRKELRKKAKNLRKEYYKIRGKQYRPPDVSYSYIGHIPNAAKKSFGLSFNELNRLKKKNFLKSKLLGYLKDKPSLTSIFSFYKRLNH